MFSVFIIGLLFASIQAYRQPLQVPPDIQLLVVEEANKKHGPMHSIEYAEQTIHYMQTILKKIANGTLSLTDAIQDENFEQATQAITSETLILEETRCESCYGAESEQSPCCNSCQEVQKAYQAKNWAFNNGEGIAQCQKEGYVQLTEDDCSLLFDCNSCVNAGCGWCLADRACRPDKPWHCQGDVDHVGNDPNVGKHRVCPTLTEINGLHEERRARRENARNMLLQEANLKSFDEESEQTVTNADHEKELERRANLAKDNYGTKFPYETLGIESTSSQGEIRKAYRKLVLLYHPDKNPSSSHAAGAFADIVAALELIGDPVKRILFDDFGSSGQETFDSYDAYVKYGKVNENNFYQGHKYITPLTENLWERRVGFGDDCWIVEYYAPWCGACQSLVTVFKQFADLLQDDYGIEVGSVNCVSQSRVCSDWFAVRAYPTILAVNDKHGMRQEYHGSKDPQSMATWAREVKEEWSWLFRNSNITTIVDKASFENVVLNSTDFFIVAFNDGLYCSSCKTAKTNLMRLSAGLRGYRGISIALVDCEDPLSQSLCHEQGLPARPHAPVVKGYASGPKEVGVLGETLYNSNEMEPHLALELMERLVRLVLADRLAEDERENGKGEYESEKEKKKDDPPPAPHKPLWNGPPKRQALAWGGGGGTPRLALK